MPGIKVLEKSKQCDTAGNAGQNRKVLEQNRRDAVSF
jgi:hypothetical protein